MKKEAKVPEAQKNIESNGVKKMITTPVELTKEELEFIKSSIEVKVVSAREGMGGNYKYPSSPYDKVVEALEELNKPKKGDRCACWDNDKEEYVVGRFVRKDNGNFPYIVDIHGALAQFKNCAKIKDDAKF